MSDRVSTQHLRRTLKDRFGLDAFREGQEEAIRQVLDGGDALVVMPTGSGKSLIYQLPALLLPGLTVVVSPLIALMKDQTDKLDELGIDALTINSSLTPKQQERQEAAVGEGGGSILYVTPERFRDREFFDALLERRVSLFVIDEAHCISQWGHDFRPDYMMLGRIAERLGRPPVLALTATAPPAVQDDIAEQLGLRGPLRIIHDLARPNLFLEVLRAASEDDKDALLVDVLEGQEGTGIVYTATVKEAERLFEAYDGRWPLALYHGQRTAKQRREAQEAFMAGDVKAVIATNAFGLGIDKPDIRFVVHYHFPGSPESYYQEAGRAGRDGRPARCSILYHEGDRRIQSYFLGGKYPAVEEAEAVTKVLDAVPQGEPKPLADLAEVADVARRKTRIVLTLLKRRGAVREHRGGEWERTVADLSGVDLEGELLDYEERREADRHKLRQIIGYCRTARCRTRFLLDYFGHGPPDDYRCGHCDNDHAALEVEPLDPEPGGGRLARPVPEPAEPAGRFREGERVLHEEFGEGVVRAVREGKVDVEFIDSVARTIRSDFLESM